jgi:hypothetical protein
VAGSVLAKKIARPERLRQVVEEGVGKQKKPKSPKTKK